jgi:hypothetical protein
MAQLNCTFRYLPTDELRGLHAADQRSFDLSLDDFFASVRTLRVFTAVSALTPAELDIDYSDV